MLDKTVRISVPIDREINDKLNNYIPRGIKATVVRELLLLLLETQKQNPESYLIENLLNKRVKLTVQNLNEKDTHD